MSPLRGEMLFQAGYTRRRVMYYVFVLKHALEAVLFSLHLPIDCSTLFFVDGSSFFNLPSVSRILSTQSSPVQEITRIVFVRKILVCHPPQSYFYYKRSLVFMNSLISCEIF